jgi:hypothetical protein
VLVACGFVAEPSLQTDAFVPDSLVGEYIPNFTRIDTNPLSPDLYGSKNTILVRRHYDEKYFHPSDHSGAVARDDGVQRHRQQYDILIRYRSRSFRAGNGRDR